ncbi:MAG TPA: hypothetical protein PKA32_04035, partial [Candidatus Gracilibacteria bacterium]|nr:hypothetical protein [Candidatus Gracilibacteria bacterium]
EGQIQYETAADEEVVQNVAAAAGEEENQPPTPEAPEEAPLEESEPIVAAENKAEPTALEQQSDDEPGILKKPESLGDDV